jgi:hypothetical protein
MRFLPPYILNFARMYGTRTLVSLGNPAMVFMALFKRLGCQATQSSFSNGS